MELVSKLGLVVCKRHPRNYQIGIVLSKTRNFGEGLDSDELLFPDGKREEIEFSHSDAYLPDKNPYIRIIGDYSALKEFSSKHGGPFSEHARSPEETNKYIKEIMNTALGLSKSH
jgi:hypothetical protein